MFSTGLGGGVGWGEVSGLWWQGSGGGLALNNLLGRHWTELGVSLATAFGNPSEDTSAVLSVARRATLIRRARIMS